MRWEFTHGSGRAAAAGVGTHTWDRLGGTARRADAEVMEMATPMNMDTITAAAKVTGAEVMEAGM